MGQINELFVVFKKFITSFKNLLRYYYVIMMITCWILEVKVVKKIFKIQVTSLFKIVKIYMRNQDN